MNRFRVSTPGRGVGVHAGVPEERADGIRIERDLPGRVVQRVVLLLELDRGDRRVDHVGAAVGVRETGEAFIELFRGLDEIPELFGRDVGLPGDPLVLRASDARVIEVIFEES